MTDSLVYLFGCYVFHWGGGNKDSLTGEEFCGKYLLIIWRRVLNVCPNFWNLRTHKQSWSFLQNYVIILSRFRRFSHHK